MAGQKQIGWNKLVTTALLSALFLISGLLFFSPKTSAAAVYNWVDKSTISVLGFPGDPIGAFQFKCTPATTGGYTCGAATNSQCPPVIKFGSDLSKGSLTTFTAGIKCTPLAPSTVTIGSVSKAPPVNPATAPTTTPVGGTADTIDPNLECHVSPNPLTWFLCPIINGMNNLLNQLDNAITSMLTVDQKKIFDIDCATNASGCLTAKGYNEAWQTFRSFALAILVIAAITMVIAQGLGFEVLDPYTIKKILPRLIFAIIGIALSWELMRYFVIFTNDLGQGIRQVIYYAFRGIPGHLELGGGADLLLTLLGGAAIAALGIAGLLSFVLTAALAVAIAFLVLIVRQLVIIVLILFAPVAIACSILPNTQGVFKLWHESFTKALLMFPIIVAFLAVGKVFAVTAIGGDISNTTALNQLIGFAAYVLPYFLIPFTFKFAGGAMSRLGGIANDRGRGGFDRLKKYRGNTMAQRNHKWQNGSLYQDRGAGAIINNAGRRKAVGFQGRFGVGKTGKAAMATATMANNEDALKNNASLRELRNNDDANAVLAFSGGSKGGAREAVNELKTGWLSEKKAGLDEQLSTGRITQQEYNTGLASAAADVEVRSQDAFAAANGVGFSRQNAAAALQTVAQNKSRAVSAGGIDIVQNGINRLAGGNAAEAAGMAYGYQYFSREGGRADLGGNWMSGSIQSQAADISAKTGIDKLTATKHLVALDGMGRTEVPSLVRGHTSQVKQTGESLRFFMENGDAGQKELAATRLLELQKSISYASGDNQKEINKILTSAEVGVNMASTASIEQQLSARASTPGHAPIDPTALSRGARTYDRENYEGNGNAQEQIRRRREEMDR